MANMHSETEQTSETVNRWSSYELSRIGFGIGFEPFKWKRFGFLTYGGGSRWFNIGPLFIQWSWPVRDRR